MLSPAINIQRNFSVVARGDKTNAIILNKQRARQIKSGEASGSRSTHLNRSAQRTAAYLPKNSASFHDETALLKDVTLLSNL